MNMPKGLQIRKLKDELKSMGIASDLVDLEALTDSKLSYPENYRIILSKYKRTDNKARKSKTSYLGGGGGLDLSYASMRNQARSLQAQQSDANILAKRTFTEKQISRKPKLLDLWNNNPGRYDILGIDAFSSSKQRKKRYKR